MRAILGDAPIEHKVGEQRLDTRNGDGCYRGFAREQQEATQQMNVQGECIKNFPFSDPSDGLDRLLQIASCLLDIQSGGCFLIQKTRA
ncbi:hypothetical protein KSC_071690 [Ktedonobacter sp. SOSP1-52]|nr:hypothetical protein KSC_071690 [Ktedonobacter sp. SOSP1-52]